MATPAAHRHYTIEEYVQLEEYANLKHEYFAGQVYLMSGGSQEHALYAGNVIALLHPQLAGRPCRVLTGDARIRIAAAITTRIPMSASCAGRSSSRRKIASPRSIRASSSTC